MTDQTHSIVTETDERPEMVDGLKFSQLSLDDGKSNEAPTVVGDKKQDYINWDEYFMGVAFLTAMRSKDPVTQVGACIVNVDKKIVGVGYNGMPNGCCDDDFPWSKGSEDPLENKHLYVVHAELNAIVNKNSESIKGCAMYVTLFPCNECAKVIIQSGVRKIVYGSDKHAHKVTTIATKKMFDYVGIVYKQFRPSEGKILKIDFRV